MHQEQTAEGEVERRVGRRVEVEEIGGDLLEHRAVFAPEVLQSLGRERTVDLNACDAPLRSNAVGHQPHHRSRAGADVEAAHARRKPDRVKHMRGGPFPHAGLIARTLIFFGIA